MKTIEEGREELGELEQVAWQEVNEEITKVLQERIPKARRHPFEWVLIGVVMGICGMILLELIRGILWLLNY